MTQPVSRRRSQAHSAPQAPQGLSRMVPALKSVGVAVLLAAGRASGAAPAATSGTLALGRALRPPCAAPDVPFYRASVPIEFGVELEVNGLDVFDAERVLAPALHIEAVPDTWGTWLGFTNVVQKGRDVGHWRAVTDESLAGSKSVEVVSPPLRYENITLLTDAAETLARHGATVDPLAALHIHVNHTSLATADIAELIHLFDRHGDLLLRLSGTSPRQYQHWSKLFDPALSVRLRRHPPRRKSGIVAAHQATFRTPLFDIATDAQRYYVLGMKYLADGQTFEYRQLGPTVVGDELRARVDLSLALTTLARDGFLACLTAHTYNANQPQDVAAFLDALGITEGAATARSRELLLRDAADPKRFAFAEGELQQGITQAVLGAAAAYAMWHPPFAGTLQGQATQRVARAYGQAAALYSASLALEAMGFTGYEATHVARKFTFARLLLVGETGRAALEATAAAIAYGARRLSVA